MLSDPILNDKMVELISPVKVAESVSVLFIFLIERVLEAEIIEAFDIKSIIANMVPHGLLVFPELFDLWKVLGDLI